MTVGMIALVLGFFVIHSYQQNIENAEKYELQYLLGIAKTVALSLDGDAHERLICSFTEKDDITENDYNEDYNNLHTLLKNTQIVNEMESSIYTLFKSDMCSTSNEVNPAVLFGVSSTEPFFRHQYENSPDFLLENYNYGGTMGDYYTGNGHWLSAFYPIENSIGKVVGVVQLDISFCKFVAEAQRNLMNESLYALLFIFILTSVFIYVYRSILRTMLRINSTLEEAVKGRTQELNESNAALIDLNGKLENLVTQRTQQLENSNSELFNSNDKLKAFARVASHDLQAPLKMITSFAKLFQKKYGHILDEDGKVYLDYINTNAKKMATLIGDILTTSLLPSENTNKMKWVDLNEMVKETEENLAEIIKKYNAKIYYYNLPTIQGYPSEFIQLFQNLISNAIKYSRPEVAPAIKIVSHQKDDSFLITVSDNGKGITPEALKNVFGEFNRGDATDNEGYGIGLATCQRIVKQYSGTMKVTSKVGEGTCFFITMHNRQSGKEAYEASVKASMVMMGN